MRVLVTGATGFVGSHMVARLLAAGHEVGTVVRDAAKLERVLTPLDADASAVHIHPGDLLSLELPPLLQGYEALIHCAGLFSHHQRDAERMWELNVCASERLLRAAAAAGLDPVIHVSSFLAMFPPRGARIHADDPVREPRAIYTRSKAQAERDARALQQQGAPVVSLYPSSVIGPHDPTVGSGPEMIADYVNRGAVLVTQGGLVYSDVRDLARLAETLLLPGQGPRRIMACGDFISHAHLHQLLCAASGRSLKAQHVPGWLMRTLGRLGDLKQRLGGDLPALTFEAAEVLTRCVPVDDRQARQLLGKNLIGGEQGLRDMLDWMRTQGIIGDTSQ